MVGESINESRIELGGDLVARIRGKSLTITQNGTVLDYSPTIIRLPDESGRCPSLGFQRLTGHGMRFTLEQQTCTTSAFISELSTFEYRPSTREVYLVEFKVAYSSREEPDAKPRVGVLTPKDFNTIRLGNVDLGSLYRLVRTDAGK